MAVLGRLLISSSERLDLPDLLSIDSYAAGDWKFFLKGMVGDTKPYILKGFDVIDPNNAIGTQSCSIRVADSAVFYPGSNAGSFYHGLPEGNENATPLVPELRKNAVNYVYLTFSTFNSSVDTRAFWDPDKDGGAGGEFTQDVNTESVLKIDVNVSTGSFPVNTIPVAKVTVGPVVITAIEDARDMMFRLGSGGISPDPFSRYNWRSLPSSPYERAEPPTEMMAGGVNPFQGADKNIVTLKEWMDAIMTKLAELGGTTYWYEDASTFSVVTGFTDALATAFKSKGSWIHDSTTPGLITWTEDINVKITADPRTYIFRQGNKTLADEQVMYLPLTRDALLNGTDEDVSWTNGANYINTVGGAVGLFANLSKGDYVKKKNDSNDKFLRVEEFYDAINLGGSTTTAVNAKSVRLSSTYLGTTSQEKGRYDKGVYASSDVVVSNRDVSAIQTAGGNFHWLAMRSDTIENVGNVATTTLTVDIDQHDGKTARVTSGSPHGLQDGNRVTITGSTNFNGTYPVEVESTTVFYITLEAGPFANESARTARYAVVTTAARSTAYGLQLESANHGFKSNDTIIIAGTTNYNGSYKVSVIDSTSFNIPVSAANSAETTGTATLARMIIRIDGGITQVIQGETVDIGGSVADNIRQFVGMNSLSETSPSYSIPASYNTLDGMQNYNSLVAENLTNRVSKLTAMMADKAQDKTVGYLHSGYQSYTNTTSGANQILTFTADANPPAQLSISLPGSPGNFIVGLGGSLTLAANQVGYVTVDRNAAGSVANLGAVSIASITSLNIDENIMIIATRLSGTDIWLWDGSRIPANWTIPSAEYQGQGIKLVGGGTITNTGGTSLSFTSDFYLEKAGLSYTDNTISTSNSPIAFSASGQIAYVIPNLGPGGPSLTISVNTLPNVPVNAVMIARREGTDIIVGSSSSRYISGESKKLYAGSSDQTLTYTGQPDAADDTPTYTNVTNGLAGYPVVQGDDLTLAIGQTMGNVNDVLTALDQPAYDEFREIVSGSPTGNQLLGPVLNGTTIDLPVNSRLIGSPQQYYVVGKGTLEIFLNGQILQLGEAGGWSEIGVSLTNSYQITIDQQLEVGDFLTFRIDGTGGPGSGGAGAPDDDFFTLPQSFSPDNGDFVLTYDVGDNAYRKQTRSTFLSGLGGFLNINTYTVDHTADINTDDVILMDVSVTARTVTLPPANTAAGKIFYIKKIDATGNAVIIDGDGSLIDGSSTINTTTQFESFTITSDGINWWIL